MKITLLVSNLSKNPIARTYPLAAVLARHFTVEIVGPLFEEEAYTPYEGLLPRRTVDYRRLRFPRPVQLARQLLRRIDGDIVYAFKPITTSFGIGLLDRLSRRKPLALDIEDWEAAEYHRQTLPAKALGWLRSPGDLLSPAHRGLMERLVPRADAITVASAFLRERYGGTRIYHGPDSGLFDPAKHSPDALRRKWGLSDFKVVLFGGYATPHKGLEQLAEAVEAQPDGRVRLLIVGARNSFVEKLLSRPSGRVLSIGLQPYSAMPELLAASDLVAAPQRDTPYAQAQVPAKLFEAMSMAKPIIATGVSDMPEILSGCGRVVEPERPDLLAGAIDELLGDPADARRMGERARLKYIEQYGWDAAEKILLPIFRKLGGRNP